MSQASSERIRFLCQQCQQMLSIAARKVGQTVECPKCQSKVTVPAREQAAEMVAARQATLAAASPDVQAQSLSEFVVYDDESDIDASVPPAFQFKSAAVPTAPIDRNKVAVSRNILYMQGVLLGVVTLASFSFGVIVGGGVAATRPRGAAVAVGDDRPCVLTGKLTFGVGVHSQMPDKGAVVIVLPEQARPDQDEKVAPAGLRPADSPPPPNQPGVAAIGVLGGAYGRTDDAGNFSVQVPRPGKYFVLLLSRGATRRPGELLKPEDLAQMGRYFAPPTDLIGQQAYRWTVETIEPGWRISYVFAKTE